MGKYCRSHETQCPRQENEETANVSVANVKNKAAIVHEKPCPEENMGLSPSTSNVSNGSFHCPDINMCMDEFVPSDTQWALPRVQCFGLGKMHPRFVVLLNRFQSKPYS